MEKKKTPVSTVIFYIIGIILLIVAAFMLWTAVNYTKTYLTSYEATFKDMWTNSVQYIITQFVPYLGMGVICIGIGRAIYGSANAKVAQAAESAEAPADAAETPADAPADGAAEAAADNAETEAPAKAAAGVAAAGAAGAAAGAGAVSASQLEELIRRIDTNREVLSIKIEEKEKRDSFRIKELEKKVDGFLSDVKYINEPLEELVYKQAAGIDDTAEEAADTAEETADTADMETAAVAAAAVAAAGAAEAIDTTEAEAAEPAPAVAIPQIFTVSRRMTAPACPAAKPAAEEPASVTEAGVVPQIFTVSRRMTAPACPVVQD